MYTYTKIAKHKNIIYYIGQATSKSKHYFIIADLHKLPNYSTYYEEVIAWIDKSKNITWNSETENIIDKNIIKNFVINEL